MGIKHKIIAGVTFVSILLTSGCQAQQQTAAPAQSETGVVAAATAYVKGFMQGDQAKYDTYYGEGAFEKEVNKQVELVNLPKTSETGMSAETWKQMMVQSKKMYAQAEVVAIEKKDEATATVKVRPLGVKVSDREAWMAKKQEELTIALQKGDSEAQKKMNALFGEVFEVIASGEIASTLEAEETYDMRFIEKDGKLYPIDDLNTISSFFLKNK